MPRRFNCCVFNHPCPICCPVNLSCRNEVVNPILGTAYGFFNNTTGGTFASEQIIPVELVVFGGEGISPSGNGGVILSAGTYEVNYFAGGTIPASGTLSVKLRLNGVDVDGSIVSSTQDVGSTVNLTRTIVVTVAEGSVLELINNTNENATFSFASMFIRRL